MLIFTAVWLILVAFYMLLMAYVTTITSNSIGDLAVELTVMVVNVVLAVLILLSL